MSAPIAMPMLPTESLLLGAAPSGDPIDAAAFSMTLGAAMAAAVIVPPARVPMPEPLALELFLDGEWVAEDAVHSDGETVDVERTNDPGTPEAATEAGHLAISADPEPAISLERELALWAARVGRAPDDDVATDPAIEVSSDRDEAGIELTGEAGDLSITKGPVAPVVGLPAPVAEAATTLLGKGLVESDREVREPVRLEPAESRSVQARAESRWGPIDDGGLADETVPGSVLLERRAALIEIAGFAFPTDHAEELAAPIATGRPAVRPEPGERQVGASFEAALTTDQELEALARVTLDTFRASVRESRPAGRLDGMGATLEGARVVGIARADVARTEVTPPDVRRLDGARAELTRLEGTRPGDLAERGQAQGETNHDGPSGNGQAGVGQEGGGREQWAAARGAHQPAAATFDARVDSGASLVAPTPVAVTTPVIRRDQVTIQLTDEGGEVGRIRVAVNGPTVRATIIPHDPALADRLNGNLRELRRSLEERGFAEPRVTIQAPRPVEAAPAITTRELVFDVHGATEFRAPTRNPADDRWREPAGDDPRGGREQRQRSPDRSKDQRHDQRRSDQ